MLKKRINDYLFQEPDDDETDEPIDVGNNIRSLIHAYVPDESEHDPIPEEQSQGKESDKEETKENNQVSELAVARMLAKQLHIDFVDLDELFIDTRAVSLLSNDYIRRFNLLPVGFEGGRLIAVMSGKTSIEAIHDAYNLTGYYIVPVVATESALQEAIEKYAGSHLDSDTAEVVEEQVNQPISSGPAQEDPSSAIESDLQAVADTIISGTDNVEEVDLSIIDTPDIDEGEQEETNQPCISELDVAKSVAKQLRIDYVDLGSYEINPQALSLISSEHIQRYKLLPIDFDGDNLVVAMSDPTDIFTIDDLHVMTGYNIVPVVTLQSELQAAINRFSTSDVAVEEALEGIDGDDGILQGLDHLHVEEEVDEAPVVKLVNLIVTEAFRERASDVFIEPQEKEVRVRYRVDGVLQEVMRSPKHVQSGVISRIKIMAGLDIAERRLPQDGRFGLVIDKKPVDFRVATLPTIHGEQVVLRLLEKDNIMLDLDDLGFLPNSLDTFKGSFNKPYGAILITGPTGSGKTTTLYSVLNILNSTEKNLITVEDPVEYRLQGINQVQVNTKAGLTFATALRSILRHDPDIIMIGEIRDEETATIAIESALTGHLVLSTIHTNTAPATLTRLIEMGIEPFLVSSAVDCIVAQRLARKLCTKCKEPFEPTKEELIEAGFKIDGSEPKELYKARGCKFCGNTGYQGRIGLYEVMTVTENIERILVGKFTVDDIAKVAISEGMKTLREDGLEKIRAGLTSIEEVARVTM